jgi:hypothetical protein
MDRLRIKFTCIPALVLLIIPIFIFLPALLSNQPALAPGSDNSTGSNGSSLFLVDLILEHE